MHAEDDATAFMLIQNFKWLRDRSRPIRMTDTSVSCNLRAWAVLVQSNESYSALSPLVHGDIAH